MRLVARWATVVVMAVCGAMFAVVALVGAAFSFHPISGGHRDVIEGWAYVGLGILSVTAPAVTWWLLFRRRGVGSSYPR